MAVEIGTVGGIVRKEGMMITVNGDAMGKGGQKKTIVIVVMMVEMYIL